MAKLRIPAKTYRRKGKLIRRKGYFKKDVGAQGRTPIRKRWYHPQEDLGGWSKDLSIEERRDLALAACENDYLLAARKLQALANVTTDKPTKAKAASDAKYFFQEYKKYKEE
jgi:hypothetical protein